MKNQTTIILLIVALFAGSYFIFKEKPTDNNNSDTDTNGGQPAPPKVPPAPTDRQRITTIAEQFQDWNGRPTTQADWGSVAAQIRQFIGFDPNTYANGDGYAIVFGFLKGYNIEVGNGWSIRIFKDYIKRYVQESGLTDLEVTTGEFLN